MSMHAPSKHEHLYDLSIASLELSDRVVKALKKVSITSVGDCIEFFIQDKINAYPAERADYMDEMMKEARPSGPAPFYIYMYQNVQQALVDHGYWSFVEAANISNTLERRAARKRSIVQQQAKHQHLYDIPLEGLGLSSRALSALQRVSITSVGDCVRFFAQTRDDYPVDMAAYRDKLDGLSKTVSQVPFFVYMVLEAEPILKERGYWSYVEDSSMTSDVKRPDMQKMTYGPLSPYQHLFEVPIEHLRLSVTGGAIIRRLGITSVGDCIDFYRRGMEGSSAIANRQQSVQIMYGEVQLKMKEYGYWSFVETNFKQQSSMLP